MMQNRGSEICVRLNSPSNVTIESWEGFKYFTFKYDLAEAGSH